MSEKSEKKETKVEVAKRASRHLRGKIAETLGSEATHFDGDDANLLKFHGSYQQDDRDKRRERREADQEPDYSFMVRVALPGGALSAEQYLALDEIAGNYANGTLRITTRQGLQFHGVYKPHLRTTIATINEKLMTTLAACGDVERNVMCCPAPLDDLPHRAVGIVARQIAEELRPATRAYHEIWLGEDKVATTEEKEPFYGEQYLPRKFKTGVALETDNCVDVYSYDCGLIAIVQDGTVQGFNVVVGGGMGMTHERADTFAALAQPLGYVVVENAVEAVRTVAAIFRDEGNRTDRKHARLKYLLQEWGMEKFRVEFIRRVDFALAAPVPTQQLEFHDHLGRHFQGDGRWFYGVRVENGRVVDRGERRTRTALRKIVARFRPGIRFTPHQNILFTNLEQETIDEIEQVLADHGLAPAYQLSAARRYSMACPALPTCGVAITESERAMPGVVDRFEHVLDELGLREVPLTLRMTGCPNGCARPYTADIAFVGRKPGEQYNVYVGGGLLGDRVGDLYAEDVHIDALVDVVRPLLVHFARERGESEGLSDFYHRLIGTTTRRTSISGDEVPTAVRIPLEVLN